MLQDFGNSRRLETRHSDMQTFVGCAQYMSPERICGAKYTSKADVWSVGLILFECFLGRFPYDVSPDTGPFELCDLILTDPVPLHLLAFADGDTPARLFRALIQRCLTKNKDHRPSAAQLLVRPPIVRGGARGGAGGAGGGGIGGGEGGADGAGRLAFHAQQGGGWAATGPATPCTPSTPAAASSLSAPTPQEGEAGAGIALDGGAVRGRCGYCFCDCDCYCFCYCYG